MKVAVCVPHRPADEEREANFRRTRQQWDALGWPVYTGNNPEPIFSRSRSVNLAAAQAIDADVLIVSDNDILLSNPGQAIDATQEALDHHAYVVTFSTLFVLDWDDTRAVRRGADPQPAKAIETLRLIWGGLFAVPRPLFDQVGGFDERFTGWGSQDIAFMVSCSTLASKRRIEGDAYHLRHHPMWESHSQNPTVYDDNALAQRYLAADGNVGEITAILAERT